MDQQNKTIDEGSTMDSGFDGSPVMTSTPRAQRSLTTRTPLYRSRHDEHTSSGEHSTGARDKWTLFVHWFSIPFMLFGIYMLMLYGGYDHLSNYIAINIDSLQRYVRRGGIIGLLCVMSLTVIFVVMRSIWITLKFSRRKAVTFDRGSREDSSANVQQIENTGEAKVCRKCNNFPFHTKYHFEYKVRRTFSGKRTDIWPEFIDYFENIAELNMWNEERKTRVLISTLCGQASTYVYGLQRLYKRNYILLLQKMDERFGFKAMREIYITEARSRRKKTGESLRDFGQALEDLYRRAYQDKPDLASELSLQSFLNKCDNSEDFRLAVKRTKPRNISEAVSHALYEECLRAEERELPPENMSNIRQCVQRSHGERRYMKNSQRKHVRNGNIQSDKPHRSYGSYDNKSRENARMHDPTQDDTRANTTKGRRGSRITDCTGETFRSPCRETGSKLRYKGSTRTLLKHPSRNTPVASDGSSTTADTRNLYKKRPARNHSGSDESGVSTTCTTGSEPEYGKSTTEEYTLPCMQSNKEIDTENIFTEDSESGSESGYETLTSGRR